MWTDNETDRDFLNFRYVAHIAAEMIAQADGRPLSLGVSGSWGVGKSSMMKLLAQSLREKSSDKFLFVEFNAWLYQGFDDTRAALMEIIARAMLARAEEQKGTVGKAVEKAKGLLARVSWFRLASVSATTKRPRLAYHAEKSEVSGSVPVTVEKIRISVPGRIPKRRVTHSGTEVNTAPMRKRTAPSAPPVHASAAVIATTAAAASHVYRSTKRRRITRNSIPMMIAAG